MAPLSSPSARDAALAAVLTAATQAEVLLAGDRVSPPLPLQHLAFAVMTASVALRRAAPLVATAVTAGGMAAQALAGDAPVVGGFLAMLVVLASLGYHASWPRGAVGVGVLATGVGTSDAVSGALDVADLVGNLVIVAMAWVSGRLVRISTDRRVAAELDRDRAAQAAAAAERSRIARDLHDSVAHALTLMTLQAGGARERSVQDEVTEQLRMIEEGGRAALQDMHRFLRLLGPAGAEEAPGLQDLDDLVERVRAGGLQVALVCDVAPGEVPPSVSATAYRVVQEGLTNAVKHSGGSAVTVVVRTGEGVLEVDVRDDGRGGPPALPQGSGRGLPALRERLALFDATLTAGRTGAGSWRTAARIPLGGGPT